jgi:hypothetical protein
MQNIKTSRSLFLFLLFLFCHLDEGILQHCCTSNLTHKGISSQLSIVMSDTLCDSVAIDADFILGEGLLYVLDLIVRLTYYFLLCLAKNLLESLLLWGVCMSSQSRADYVELRRDRKSCTRLIFFNMSRNFTTNEGIFD